jgi:hypothetical protein
MANFSRSAYAARMGEITSAAMQKLIGSTRSAF